MAALNKLLLLKQQLILLMILRRQKPRRKNANSKKRMWVRQIFLECETKGEYQVLVTNLRLIDSEYFFRNFRMTPTKFELILSWIAPFVKKSSKRRPTTTPAERLCVTLRYLATGDAQFTIASSYHITPTTVCRIIRETTQCFWDVLLQKGY